MASSLAAFPVLVFNGHGWYPVVDFYKWALTFPIVAYATGVAAFMLLWQRDDVQVTRIELTWLALILLIMLQPFFISLRSFHEWLRNMYFFAALGGAVFVLRNLPIDGAMSGILRAVTVTGGASTLIAFTQSLAPDLRLPFILDASGAPDRFLANTGLDNLLGAYLALAIVAGVWLLLYCKASGKFALSLKASDFLLLILNCVGIWKTGTRSALIACAAGVLVLLIASGFMKRSLKIAAAIGILLICLAFAAPDVLRVERRDMSRLFTPDVLSMQYEGRWAIWLTSWEMIKTAPLLGVGLGNYKWNYMDALATFKEVHSLPPRYTFWAHNEYIQWVAETGALGGALFFSFLIYCIWLCVKGIRKKKSDSSCLVWSLAAIAVLMVDSCFSRPMRHVDTAFTLSLAMAMISRLESAPVKLFPKMRWGVSGMMILVSLSGIILFAQSIEGRRYLGERFYSPFYISLLSSEEREQYRRPPLLLEDSFLQLTARENYRRTWLGFGDTEQNDQDAIRLLSRYFETQPRYEELNLLMLIFQRRGEFEEAKRYFRFFPPEERERILRGEFQGRYMLER